ncbi:MAG: hypothetical protein QM758_18140 [Armatimonas sp.]
MFPVEGLPLPTEGDLATLSLEDLETRYPGLEMLSKSLKAAGSDTLSASRAESVVALLRQSGGLPLSIELLATRINKQGEILPSLHDIKTSAGSPRGAIDWALEPLSTATRAFLQRLSIFEGAFGIEDSKAVTGDTEVEFRLTELDDAGLITLVRKDKLDDPIYRLSPAVREFVREDLEVSPEFPTLLMQYEGYFAQLAAEGNIGLRGLERIIWLPRLKQAAGDILSVIHRNLKADSHVGFAAEVFSTFAHFFVVNSNPHEGMSLAERVLNRIHEAGDLPQLLEIEAIDAWEDYRLLQVSIQRPR